MSLIHVNVKRGAAGALTAGLLLLQSCSYTTMPRIVPPVKQNQGDQFKGTSVLVTNAEKDSAESPILTETKGSSAFRANRRAWCQKLVEALARELAREGADVRVNAPVTLSVALPDIVFTETSQLLQFTTKAAVTTSSGWTKFYEGTANIETSKVFSPSKEADRLAGRALANTVETIVGDPDFAAQLAEESMKQRGRLEVKNKNEN